MLVNQIDSEHAFRPCRFSLSLTGPLESADRMCKYELWVPIERIPVHYIINHYVFICMVCCLDCTLPFWLAPDDMANRTMTVLTLYLLLVTYKYTMQENLPVLPYTTALDRYILLNFFHLAATLLAVRLAGDPNNNNNNADGAIASSDLAQRAIVALAGAIHLYCLFEWHRAKAKRLLCVSGAGVIDPVMQGLLRSHGLELNALGLVKDRALYQSLLSSGKLRGGGVVDGSGGGGEGMAPHSTPTRRPVARPGVRYPSRGGKRC